MNYLGLIKAAAATGLPVLLDARATKGELNAAVGACLKADVSNVYGITIVHCPTGYPAKDEGANLGMIREYLRLYGPPIAQIGYSDHSTGWSGCIAAVAAGASFIEKTVTLDCSTPGPEHIMSLEPGEVGAMVADVRMTARRLGTKWPEPNTQFRRSLFATRDIKAGETITEDMLAFKRPGDGISVATWEARGDRWWESLGGVPEGAMLDPVDILW